MDLSKYRALKYGRTLVHNRVIIVDEPLPRDRRGKLHNLRTPDGEGFVLLNDFELSERLEVLLGNALQGTENTLIVFPGRGARYPRRHSELLTRFPCVEVDAGRFWIPGSEPVAYADTILPYHFLNFRLERIVVVDDVICSGATMRALHNRNAWRFPLARWVAAAWVVQRPRSGKPSGLSGYEAVLGGCIVSKPDGGRSAVNSLSTLRADREVIHSYAERHLVEEDREKFMRCLQT